MKQEFIGKVTGVRQDVSDPPVVTSELTFPDFTGRNPMFNYYSFQILGKLELGQDVKITITDEVEESK